MGKAVRIVGMLKLLKIARIAEVLLSRSSFEALLSMHAPQMCSQEEKEERVVH